MIEVWQNGRRPSVRQAGLKKRTCDRVCCQDAGPAGCALCALQPRLFLRLLRIRQTQQFVFCEPWLKGSVCHVNPAVNQSTGLGVNSKRGLAGCAKAAPRPFTVTWISGCVYVVYFNSNLLFLSSSFLSRIVSRDKNVGV